MTKPALLSQLEELKGPDREADAALHVAFCQPEPIEGDETRRYRLPHPSLDDMGQCRPGHYWYVQRSGRGLQSAPHYTSSIDALISLIEAKLPDRVLGVIGVGMTLFAASDYSEEPPSKHLARFVCIAFLKALIQMENENG